MKLLQLSPYIEELCITYGNELEDVEMNFEKEDMALQLYNLQLLGLIFTYLFLQETIP